MADIYKVLHDIQVNMKAKKGRFNKFGDFYYRSLEDIKEAVKPLLPEGYCIMESDEIIIISNGWTYVKSTVSLIAPDGSRIDAAAHAREEETRKGMCPAQITGSSSSYARKYAYNGLFGLDDTADPDMSASEKPKRTTPKDEVFAEDRETLIKFRDGMLATQTLDEFNDYVINEGKKVSPVEKATAWNDAIKYAKKTFDADFDGETKRFFVDSIPH